MKALVYKSTGSWYQLKTEDGKVLQARIFGKLKLENITSTNPIAVGDWVELENVEDEGSIMITKIFERSNYINRISPHNKNMHHIVAANLNQSLLFATLKEPKTSLGFIDRFLVISEAYHVPAIIVFNKCDLWKKKENDRFEYIKDMYEKIGYKILQISVEKQQGLEEVEQILKNKTTLLSGHSGVGKSSFINYIFPQLQLKTNEVSGWSGKGMHTTTFAEMFDLPFGGCVIDTPGIREMGIVDISKQELSHYFPEMKTLIQQCQFNNCSHLHEPGCAVKEAVNNGSISEERYLSYLNIRDTIDEKSY
ncbi:MAG TPA: ribosome small subunit-dependent GTPase A [Ferruginibacter sp.]|nr:ribosome small subunit-dependent GTPase A [Ferruginibacter sp.]HRE64517.1 ribosome small subunit-dependent GTPase A [Ferruginibacter sp.]